VELWRESASPPTIVIVLIYILGCMYQGYDIGKNRKSHCSKNKVSKKTISFPIPPPQPGNSRTSRWAIGWLRSRSDNMRKTVQVFPS
jgi:hypothetical protein